MPRLGSSYFAPTIPTPSYANMEPARPAGDLLDGHIPHLINDSVPSEVTYTPEPVSAYVVSAAMAQTLTFNQIPKPESMRFLYLDTAVRTPRGVVKSSRSKALKPKAGRARTRPIVGEEEEEEEVASKRRRIERSEKGAAIAEHLNWQLEYADRKCLGVVPGEALVAFLYLYFYQYQNFVRCLEALND